MKPIAEIKFRVERMLPETAMSLREDLLALLDRLEAAEAALREIRDNDESDPAKYGTQAYQTATEVVGEEP